MVKEQRFEEMMKKLERIVDSLETGEVDLEESLKKYEEGTKLLQMLRKKLDKVKRKVEILIKENGKLTTEPFEE